MPVSTHTVDGVAELPDLRESIRDEHIPAACLLLRGGPDSVAKLRRHAERMRRAFLFDGDPVLGISMFAALDVFGVDSRGTAYCLDVFRRTDSSMLCPQAISLRPDSWSSRPSVGRT
jgi:hypothetical protein